MPFHGREHIPSPFSGLVRKDRLGGTDEDLPVGRSRYDQSRVRRGHPIYIPSRRPVQGSRGDLRSRSENDKRSDLSKANHNNIIRLKSGFLKLLLGFRSSSFVNPLVSGQAEANLSLIPHS